MMFICVSVLTIAHPGLTLGAHWNRGTFHWNQKRYQEGEKQHPHQAPANTAGAELERREQSSGGSSENGDAKKEMSVDKEGGRVL